MTRLIEKSASKDTGQIDLKHCVQICLFIPDVDFEFAKVILKCDPVTWKRNDILTTRVRNRNICEPHNYMRDNLYTNILYKHNLSRLSQFK